MFLGKTLDSHNAFLLPGVYFEDKPLFHVLGFQVEADTAIQQCKAAISSLEHCKGLLQVEVSRLEESVRELQAELELQTELNKDCDEQEQKERQW